MTNRAYFFCYWLFGKLRVGHVRKRKDDPWHRRPWLLRWNMTGPKWAWVLKKIWPSRSTHANLEKNSQRTRGVASEESFRTRKTKIGLELLEKARPFKDTCRLDEFHVHSWHHVINKKTRPKYTRIFVDPRRTLVHKFNFWLLSSWHCCTFKVFFNIYNISLFVFVIDFLTSSTKVNCHVLVIVRDSVSYN